MDASSERIMGPGFQVSESVFRYRGIPRNKAFISRNQTSSTVVFSERENGERIVSSLSEASQQFEWDGMNVLVCMMHRP